MEGRPSENNYRLLAVAILNQAIKDYEFLMGMGEDYSEKRHHKLMSLSEIETFFHSDWFIVLCEENGPVVYQKIKDNYKRYGRCCPFYDPEGRGEEHYRGIKIDALF